MLDPNDLREAHWSNVTALQQQICDTVVSIKLDIERRKSEQDLLSSATFNRKYDITFHRQMWLS